MKRDEKKMKWELLQVKRMKIRKKRPAPFLINNSEKKQA